MPYGTTSCYRILPTSNMAAPQPLMVMVSVLITMASALGKAVGPDVRHLLGTKTSYAQRLMIPGAPSVHGSPDPEGYTAHALWLMSRHGTRWPTSERMKQIDALESVFQDAKNTKHFPWLRGWKSPTAGLQYAAGELHPIGEGELWSLAIRLRKRFPNLLRSSYLPRRFPIQSSQVSRAAASASAFTSGFFPPVPSLDPFNGFNDNISDDFDMNSQGLPRSLLANAGSGKRVVSSELVQHHLRQQKERPQPVAINMLPKNKDPLLRFYDMCPAYAQREEYLGKWLSAWLADGWASITDKVGERLGMTRPLNPCDVEALWTLCQFEAGLKGISDQACSVFDLEDINMLEWLDDVDLLESHGWGSPVNYRIAAPLLQDMRKSLQGAAQKEDKSLHVHARLLFGHCETLVPLAALMGLFKPDKMTPPAVQMPSQSLLDATAPVQEAQTLVQTADSLEDLHTVNIQSRLQVGKARSLLTGSTGPNEGLDTCVKGIPTAEVPIPAGWFPMTPFNESRPFRGGFVSPYGANMAVVLYKSREAHSDGRHHYRVRLLYNEQVVKLPGCPPIGVPTTSDPMAGLDCDLDNFLAATEQAAGGPDTLTGWCSPASSAA